MYSSRSCRIAFHVYVRDWCKDKDIQHASLELQQLFGGPSHDGRVLTAYVDVAQQYLETPFKDSLRKDGILEAQLLQQLPGQQLHLQFLVLHCVGETGVDEGLGSYLPARHYN